MTLYSEYTMYQSSSFYFTYGLRSLALAMVLAKHPWAWGISILGYVLESVHHMRMLDVYSYQLFNSSSVWYVCLTIFHHLLAVLILAYMLTVTNPAILNLFSTGYRLAELSTVPSLVFFWFPSIRNWYSRMLSNIFYLSIKFSYLWPLVFDNKELMWDISPWLSLGVYLIMIISSTNEIYFLFKCLTTEIEI